MGTLLKKLLKSITFHNFSVGLLFFLLSLFGCGESTSLNKTKKQKVIVAIDVTLPPMAFLNDQKEIIGFDRDLIDAVAERAGWDVKIINVEWAGLFGGLITHKFDVVISSVTILEERKKRMAFSIPYLRSGIALVVRKDTKNISSLEDAKKQGLTVGAKLGTTAYFLLEKKKDIKYKGYQEYGHAIADLIKKEIDIVLGESTGTLYYKANAPELFEKIKMIGENMTEEFYGIVLRKEDVSLMEELNQALLGLLNDGTVQKFHDKWTLGKAAMVPENTY